MEKNSGQLTCKECGCRHTASRSDARFCCNRCRLAFNNRRAKRGAELYDLFMVMRYDRAEAKRHGVWALMCRMGQQMREEDQAERAGRQSWRSPQEALKDRADLRAIRS